MHIYAFGSICRGDLDTDSDIDLLAIVEGQDSRFNANAFSIYSYERIKELWAEGNPFAWHLARESRMLFSGDETDFIRSLGNPNRYRNCVHDCRKFLLLFQQARQSLVNSKGSGVFELSIVFLSIRNIATCFSLGMGSKPNFSRRAAFDLGVRNAPISDELYAVLHRCRVLSTRGNGVPPGDAETAFAVRSLPVIEKWMIGLVEEAQKYERVHQPN
ncbi:MAG: nucleotidyltransferase domain-containing protein [Verrucomicrobiota bacterium]